MSSQPPVESEKDHGVATTDSEKTHSRRSPAEWLRLWFRVDRDVDPVEFAVSGFGSRSM
jgi:hypothetical protein